MEVVFGKPEAEYQPVATSSQDMPRLQNNDDISKLALTLLAWVLPAG